MKVVEMKGLRFGTLIVLRRVENNNKGQAVWLCECDCGKKKEYLGIRIRNKSPLSCGCDLKKRTKEWRKVGGYRQNSGRKSTSLKDRIKGRYVVNAITGCWEWTGHTKSSKMGYGRINYNGQYLTAHKGSYIAFVGEVPKGMYVCHSCDNPPCVNPDHLFIGTHKDNMIDMKNKKRSGALKGELATNSILKVEDILNIRKEYVYRSTKYGCPALADKYGVSSSHILDIVKKKRWAHV